MTHIPCFFRNFTTHFQTYTFFKMKLRTILHILGLFVLSAALLFITQSWWMALGILILILLVDSFLKQYDNKRKQEWLRKHREEIENGQELKEND